MSDTYSKNQTQAIHHYLNDWSKHYSNILDEANKKLITISKEDKKIIQANLKVINKMYEALNYDGSTHCVDYFKFVSVNPIPKEK